jgi:hypothetical protein
VRRRARWAAALALPLAAAALLVAVPGGATGEPASVDPLGGPLQEVRDATARYQDVNQAIDAGYVQFFGCVHEPLAGSMGIHFVNGALAGDTALEPTTPEALIYEVKPNGKLALVGVEYVVFQEAWDAANPAPPTLFDQTFTLIPSPNRFGIPAFYELHAWTSKPNPTGSFKDWNPAVLCPGTEGHVH